MPVSVADFEMSLVLRIVGYIFHGTKARVVVVVKVLVDLCPVSKKEGGIFASDRSVREDQDDQVVFGVGAPIELSSINIHDENGEYLLSIVLKKVEVIYLSMGSLGMMHSPPFYTLCVNGSVQFPAWTEYHASKTYDLFEPNMPRLELLASK